MVLRGSPEPKGILAIYTGAEPRGNPVTFRAGGSRLPATHETVSAGLHFTPVGSRQVNKFGKSRGVEGRAAPKPDSRFARRGN
jgi:hypothetical protein